MELFGNPSRTSQNRCRLKLLDTMALQATEYEYHHYQFDCADVVAGVKNILENIIDHSMNDLMKKLSVKYDADLVAEAVNTLLKSYYSAILNRTPELEKIVECHFAIQNHILLPEDNIHENEYSSNYEEILDQKIMATKKKLLASDLLERKLSHLIKSILNIDPHSISAQLDSANSTLSALQKFMPFLNRSIQNGNIDVQTLILQSGLLSQSPCESEE